jgi:hypothetical protein
MEWIRSDSGSTLPFVSGALDVITTAVGGGGGGAQLQRKDIKGAKDVKAKETMESTPASAALETNRDQDRPIGAGSAVAIVLLSFL